MNNNKKNYGVVMCIFILCISMSGLLSGDKVSAAEDTNLKIVQTMEQSECEPGDLVMVSVSLEGVADMLEISGIEGEIELDTCLFSVSAVEANGMSTEHVDNETFSLSGNRTIHNGDVLLQVALKVNEDAKDGKTTVCIGNVVLTGTDGEKHTIMNFIPSSITIIPMASKTNTETNQGENSKEDDAQTEDEKLDNEKDTVSNEEKENKDVTAEETTNQDNSSQQNKDTAKDKEMKTVSKKLDTNYKTDAGFGNDIFLLGALLCGGMVCVSYVIYKKYAG